MAKIELLHGSDHVIKKPELGLGKINNDYGQGFYCTENPSMAKEWACKNNTDGFVNKYVLDMEGLTVLNLLDGDYNILHWMALLLKNRTFRLSNEIAVDARDYIIDNFLIDLSDYDVVIGYRADDSYFSFAEAFVQNGLSLRSLNEALRLGKLGTQVVLVSEKAFKKLSYEGEEIAEKNIYYPKFVDRDSGARNTYNKVGFADSIGEVDFVDIPEISKRYFLHIRKEIKKKPSYKDDIFVLDILREEMKSDDARIQRIVSE